MVKLTRAQTHVGPGVAVYATGGECLCANVVLSCIIILGKHTVDGKDHSTTMTLYMNTRAPPLKSLMPRLEAFRNLN